MKAKTSNFIWIRGNVVCKFGSVRNFTFCSGSRNYLTHGKTHNKFEISEKAYAKNMLLLGQFRPKNLVCKKNPLFANFTPFWGLKTVSLLKLYVFTGSTVSLELMH